MDKLLQGLKNTTQKAKANLKDWLSVDEGETSPSVVERAGQTIQDIFKKDVVKPVPQDGKEYISPAVRTTPQKIADKIRSTDTGNILMSALFGDGTNDYFKGKIDGKEQGFSLLPKEGEGIVEYLLPETTKDDTTRILERYDSLKEKGVGDERATKVAVEDVMKPKAGSMEDFMATKEGKKTDLTDEEKSVLRKKNLMETLGLGLDVIGNTPFGAITKKGGTKTVSELARKFKSYDEFKNALNINFRDSMFAGNKADNADEIMSQLGGLEFHGTPATDKIKQEGFKGGEYYNSGVYTTNNPQRAIGYEDRMRNGQGDFGIFVVDPKEFKIKDLTYNEFRDINKGGGEDLVTSLKKKGYDGIRTKDGEESLIWNVAKLNEKKPQTLREIWEEAQKGEGEQVVEQVAKTDTVKTPKRLSDSVRKDVLKEDFTNIEGVDPKNIKKVQLFGSSVEGKANPNDIDVFVTVADDAYKWKKRGGMTQPLSFERGKFSYIVMPESEGEDLLNAMLYTGRKDGDRAYSGTAVNLPKTLWKPQGEVVEDVYKNLPTTQLPKKMYHGTSVDNADSILKNGWDVSKNKKGFAEAPEAMYLSADAGKAGDHSAGTYGETLLEVSPKKGQKLNVASEEAWYQTLGKSKGGKETAEITAKLQKSGYDAIIDPSGEIIVLNPSKFTFKEAGESSAKSVADIVNEKGGMDAFLSGKGGGKEPTMGDMLTGGNVPTKTRRFTVRTEKLAPETKPLLQGKYQAKSNKNLIEEADNIIAKSRDEAEIIAKTDTSDRGIAVASRLLDTLTQEAKATKDISAKNALYEKIADISNETARNLTEAGRSIQAATILGRLTPEGMVRYAARQIQKHNERVAKGGGILGNPLSDMFGGYNKKLVKIPELTGEEVQWIQKEMERIGNIEDEVQRAKEFQAFDRKMSERIPSSLYTKIATLWKAGLLTGLKTSGLNILSNSAHALSEGAKDIPAVLVDKIISLFTGKRTLALTGQGAKEGAREGVAKGWEYLKTGFDERDIGGKLDYEIVNFGKGKVAKLLQKYEEGVFRLIGSQDQPFYYGAKARSLYSQAIAEARNKGLVGEEATKFVNDLVANPTDDMLKYATLDAETAVFQNLTALGTVGKAIQNIPYVGKFILPFAKTPSAVATQLLAYSPLGIVGTLAKYARKGKFDQRLFSQGIGRGLTGTGVMYIGATLYDSGNLALSMPTTEREKKQWELEGKKPNSIKIGDKWVSVAVLGPAGLALLVGGAYRKAYDEAGSVAKGMLQASIGGVKSFGEQTFLKGINQFTNALSDPERYGTPFFSSFIGSWIPTIVADVARATDDYERRSPGLLGKLQSRIPGIREALQPQVDTFGNEIKTPSAVRVMADATRSSDVKPSDNVTKELRRLMDAGYPATPTQVGPRDGYKTLTPSQNTQLLKISGNLEKTRLAKLMQSEAYKKADDELREKAIQREVDRAKVEARARVIYDAVSGLSKEQRIQRLKEMKDEKLLTKQVFSAYQSIKNNK